MGIAHGGECSSKAKGICAFIIIWTIIEIIVMIIFAFYRCSTGMDAKKFMVEHPEIKFQQTKDGPLYDKYTPSKVLNKLRFNNEFIFVHVGEKKYEYFLKHSFLPNPKRIGDTNYGIFLTSSTARFKIIKPIQTNPLPEPKQIKTKDKKENLKMELTIGTWIILMIIMVVVAKISHKINLKTIFRPTKKIVKHTKKEWDQS